MNWDICVEQLAAELTTEQLNTWIKPLQVEETVQSILLFAPNRFVKDWVTDRYLDRIQSFYSQHVGGTFQVTVRVGSSGLMAGATGRVVEVPKQSADVNHQPVSQPKGREPAVVEGSIKHSNRLNADFRFENFVEGKSNQLARAAAQRVSEKPGSEYNPLFLYGDTGLGKTHLMHAVGNQIRSHNPNAKIIYVHSERFV
ncbi:MAG: DnaA/Hda family protein, partial [Proteobacteria bacterium]|nr:DnaA/Hda family protein [Pseudomonadota bacterium]